MLVIGIDSHKDTLSACLVDHLGTSLEYRTIANTPAGHRQLVSWRITVMWPGWRLRGPALSAVRWRWLLSAPVWTSGRCHPS